MTFESSGPLRLERCIRGQLLLERRELRVNTIYIHLFSLIVSYPFASKFSVCILLVGVN
jgi:hypothetical protein